VPIVFRSKTRHAVPTLRAQPKIQVDPVLVTKEVAGKLIAKDTETIEHLIEKGKLPVAVVEGEILIPYLSLLELAGVARWRYQEIC
jgi:hypothetical protein